jgi:hypothetical protein
MIDGESKVAVEVVAEDEKLLFPLVSLFCSTVVISNPATFDLPHFEEIFFVTYIGTFS